MKWSSVIIGLLFLCSAYPKQKSAYEPWYTGLLIASGGITTAPNHGSFQPYVVLQSNYGFYNLKGHFQSKRNTFVVNPLLLIMGGINKFMGLQIFVQTMSKYHRSKNSTKFTDTSLMIGFQVLRDEEAEFYMRLAYIQIFPTGNYQRLSLNKGGADLTGGGSFQSNIALFMQKAVYWFYNHPIMLTWNFTIGYNSKVRVHDFNAYGGGIGANEELRPGMSFSILFAPQFSITQQWVFCFDLIYQHVMKGTKSGFPGFLTTGRLSRIDVEKIDLLTLAPAIEYNFNEQYGMLAGVQASLMGRNTLAFINGQISLLINF